jgi:hypothetical protein
MGSAGLPLTPREPDNLGSGHLAAKAVFFIVLALLATGLAILNTSDADDAMYLGASLKMIDSSSLNAVEPTFGDDTLAQHPAWRYLVWELVISVLATSTSIHPLTLFHLVVPVVMGVFSVSSYLALCKLLFGERHAYWAVLSVLLFLVTFIGSHMSPGCFILTRLWQGKAVFLHVVYPILVCALLSYLQSGRFSDYLTFSAALVAATAMNATAIYLSLTASGLLTVSFAAVNWTNFRTRRALLLGLATIVPLLVLWDIVSAIVPYYNVQEVSSAIRAFSWNALFQDFVGYDGMLLVLPVMAVVVVLMERRPFVLTVLVAYPITLILTVLNPVTGQFIGRDLGVAGNYSNRH